MLNKFVYCAIAVTALTGASSFVQESCAHVLVQTTIINGSAVPATGFNAALQGGKKFYNWSGTAAGNVNLFRDVSAGTNAFIEDFLNNATIPAAGGTFLFQSERDNRNALDLTGTSLVARNAAGMRIPIGTRLAPVRSVAVNGDPEFDITNDGTTDMDIPVSSIEGVVNNSPLPTDGSLFVPDGMVVPVTTQPSPMGSDIIIAPNDTEAFFLPNGDNPSLSMDINYQGDTFFFLIATSVPEPSSIVLLATGLMGLLLVRRRSAAAWWRIGRARFCSAQVYSV
jgi:PEP-CTERM motif